jgi:hypothetical protein
MNRTRLIVLVIAAAFWGAVLGPAAFAGDAAKEKKKDEVVVVGVLVDTKCYTMNNENYTLDHMTEKGKVEGCASASASMGLPVGLLVDGKKGGKVYVLIAPAPAFVDFMAQTVQVIGTEIIDGALAPSQIFVKNENGEWEEVEILNLM